MNAKKAWTDLQGYVKAGPETGVEGTGHEDAKAQGKEIIQTNTKNPKWSDPQPVVDNGPDLKKKEE